GDGGRLGEDGGGGRPEPGSERRRGRHEDQHRRRDGTRVYGPLAANHEGRAMTRATRWALLALSALLAVATGIQAQPPPPTAKGCCCVVEGIAYRCMEKTEADCLALQPSAPVFPKIADWRKMWDAYVAASEAQAKKPSYGGVGAASIPGRTNPQT